MKVVGSGQALGATIEGIDLAQPLPDAAYERIVQALGEHGVIRFPRQQLTGRQLRDFSARFGELDLQGGRVAEFKEKPLLSGGWINGGYFVFRRDFLDRLADDPGLVLEQGPLADLARDGELMAYRHDAFWYPMDSSRDFHYLNGLWRSGRAPWATDGPRQARAA